MNILKNMEIIFVAALAIAGTSAYIGSAEEAQATPHATQQQANIASAANAITPGIPVVVVHAKRMTALEKQQSLAEERLAMGSSRSGAL